MGRAFLADKVTVIARWESSQMSADLEWRMWRQLRGAFHIDRFIFVPTNHKMEGYTFDQADTIEEALAVLPGDCHRVFLEPSGYNSLYDMPKTGHIALILGNTSMDNMAHAQVNETYAIKTEGGIAHNHLYGINAAAIALAFEYGQ